MVYGRERSCRVLLWSGDAGKRAGWGIAACGDFLPGRAGDCAVEGLTGAALLPACEAAGKFHSQLYHRTPAAKAEPIFRRVTVCLKAYPDTNREFFRSLLRRGLHSYAAPRLRSWISLPAELRLAAQTGRQGLRVRDLHSCSSCTLL